MTAFYNEFAPYPAERWLDRWAATMRALADHTDPHDCVTCPKCDGRRLRHHACRCESKGPT